MRESWCHLACRYRYAEPFGRVHMVGLCEILLGVQGTRRYLAARARPGALPFGYIRVEQHPLGYQRHHVILSGAWDEGVSSYYCQRPADPVAPPRMRGTKSSLLQIPNCGPPGAAHSCSVHR